MKSAHRRVVAAVLASGVAAAAMAAASTGAVASGNAGDPDTWTPVPPVAKAAGVTAANSLSPQLVQRAVAQGALRLDGGTADLPYYGYDGNGPLLPKPGATPAPGTTIEASKTEPDKNTYLTLRDQTGPDAAYSYGRHFLFQGHETGTRGYLTRVNLDADDAHRVTLMADKFADGGPLPTWDGSTWDPFAHQLLLTAEGGPLGGVSQASLDFPSKVVDLGSVIGRGGYEGIQADPDGNLWIVEDAGGSTVPTSAKVPNSFVYKFVPVDRSDLTKGGKLLALQAVSDTSGQPITFQPVDAQHPSGNAFSADTKALHTYGTSFSTRWVSVHDTAQDTSGAAFNANALAKTAGATPFKRPENGVFRPGSRFREFYFTETGDTNAASTANDGYGGWGAVFKLALDRGGQTGRLSLVVNGDAADTGFDNLTFLDGDHLGVVEDAGDTLHTQRGALDSAYVVDVTKDYSTGQEPSRFLAEGRDPSATLDSAFSAISGFTNEGDNEITGIHVSNGDPTAEGLLGARTPKLFEDGWRMFWTQQHGDNTTWEVLPR
jgi:hypothetical protein